MERAMNKVSFTIIARSARIDPNDGNNVFVAIKDVDLGALISNVGISDILNAIGAKRCKAHFGVVPVPPKKKALWAIVKREKHRVEVLIIHVDPRLMRTFGTTLATDGKTRIISAPGEHTKVYPEAVLVGDATGVNNYPFPCEADAIDYEERVSRLFDSIIVDDSYEGEDDDRVY
jgi:hypothetical protein